MVDASEYKKGRSRAKRLWSIWQALLSAFAWAFTRPSFRRFAEWVTAMAINGEEHTITQSVLALERPADWKALESFAEYGAWHPDYVTASLTRLVETAPGRLWHGYHISAVDDTKVHRNSPDVWGTCTFHEYTARCPNRAPTVRAHNWVVLGALLDNPRQPPWCLPLSGRLYFRKSQLPLQAQDSDHTVVFRTKCELVVELIREQARITGGRHLGIFDGAYAQYRLTKHNHRLPKGFLQGWLSPMLGAFLLPFRHLPLDHPWVDPVAAFIRALVLHLPKQRLVPILE